MQRPSTVGLRRQAYNILLIQGRTSLSVLASQIGCPKDMLRYAIESTFPFGAMFKKIIETEIMYEAIPVNEIYGEDYY